MAVTFHEAAPGMPRGQSDRSRSGGGSEAGGSDSSCEAHPAAPWRRYCIPVTALGDITVTTTVAILPDLLPYNCSGEACDGGLV